MGCGYTISQQIQLFNNIKPLFSNKPLVIVLSKIDLVTYEQLNEQDKVLLQGLKEDNRTILVEMSNKSGDGINDVKTRACDILLEYRLAQKTENLAGGNSVIKREEDFLKGIYVAKPKSRGDAERTPNIPETVLSGQKQSLNRPTLKELQEQHGGAGVFNFPLQEHFMLEDVNWKYDVVPEIMDGKNIADFVDADILRKLEDLEKEEEMLESTYNKEDMLEEIDPAFLKAHKEVKNKKALLKLNHKMKLNRTAHQRNFALDEVTDDLQKKGLDTANLEERVKAKKKRTKLENLLKDNNNSMDEESDCNENAME